MFDNWESMTLGEFTTLKRGHDLPERLREPGNVPILGSFGVTGYHDEAKSKGPGVTVGRSGASFGVVSYSEQDFWPLNTALYVVDFHGNDERFAYYFLKSFDFTRYNSGSAQPSLNRNYIHPIKIRIPPLEEQKTISAVLGAFDDKIELNRQMNATLEEMARAIFRSWFVDFDPVHAKARGEQPYDMDAETATLFPDRFEVVDGREVPAGWQPGKLEDFLLLKRGYDLPKRKRTEGPYPILAASGPSGTHNEYKVGGPGVTTGRSGVLGNVYFVQEDYWPLNTSLYVKDFRLASPFFAYQLLSQLKLENYNAGSAVPTLNRNHIHDLPMILPPKGLIDTYETLSRPLLMKVDANQSESETLALLRDTLLPRLMSGQLRVASATVGR